MRGRWPLVGRDEELTLIEQLLEGPGVVVAGAAGTGKTRLATEASQRAAASGRPTARVAASRALSAIPYGAVAHLLPAASTRGEAPVDRLRAALERLVELGGGGRLLLAVDDAHLLDQASTALLHQAVGEELVTVLATMRTGEAVPEGIVVLWKDLGAARLELQPLSRAETARLVEAALGGPVDAAAAQRLWDSSRGNPLYLREAVWAATAAGRLVDRGGVWVLEGAVPTPSSLWELVAARLTGLEPAAARAVEVLAVAEHLGVEAVQRLGGDPGELERRQLVEVGEDGRRRTARLAHPLYGEVVRGRMPLTVATTIAGDLADLIDGCGARRREDLLRVVSWRVAAGRRVAPDTLVEAARLAYLGSDFSLAERLAAAALGEGDRLQARLLLGQLLHERGDHEAAEAQLAAASTEEPGHPRVAIPRAINLFFGLGRAEEALSLLQPRAGLGSGLEGELAANRGWLQVNRGRPAQALAEVAPLLEADDPQLRQMALVTAAWALAAAGRPGEALAAGDEALRLRDQLGARSLGRFRDHPELPRAAALVEGGRLEEAEELVTLAHRRSVEAGPSFIRAWWLLAAGRLALLQGRVATAADRFREGAALQRALHQPGHLRAHLAGLAVAQVWRGDLAAAERVLAEIEGIGNRPEELHAPWVTRARLWVAAGRGELTAAVATARAGAAQAAAFGLGSGEAMLLSDVVRLGQPAGVAERLAQLAETEGAELARLAADHATAVINAEPSGAAELAARTARIGARLVAAELHLLAAAQGADGRTRTRHRRHAMQLLARCEGAAPPSMQGVGDAGRLTPREREVVVMAARGLSGAAIADRLYISVRTVNNHLQRAYTKLGVSSRGEAAELLGIER